MKIGKVQKVHENPELVFEKYTRACNSPFVESVYNIFWDDNGSGIASYYLRYYWMFDFPLDRRLDIYG